MTRKSLSLLATAAIAALALSACGDSGDTAESSPEETGELRTVNIGLMPIAPSVAVEYGIQKGIFEEHGFELNVNPGASGAASLPAVVAGQLDFDIGNPMSVAIANDQGMDIRIAAGFSNAIPEGDDIAGIIVRADSGIETYADLEGKTTAVVSLQGHNTLTTQDVAEKDGADPEGLDFTELQFGDMTAQLEQGNVDAAFMPEPFLSRALSDPANELLGYNFQDSIPGLPTLVTYTSGELIEKDPELVKDFQVAMEDVLTQAQENKDEALAMLTDFIDVPPEAAANMRIEDWDAEIKRDEIDQLNELALKHDYIQNPIDPEGFYYE
ncbi:ABC transporter substrate-binding protein [Enteractinococcus helveticum]|uniref:SsuA/THI5-like domain-containing protein n=1 Tax=Enteractinococcus helveticum TaxID=1837282 RepID=A0A1B7M191_9MICC|nr:ABC transporter substrate-binding protein [Enteractinococcus helveticum]OAV62149.1 hypothetical protein A6F49_07610 [Enteractinococcus helveticum]